MISGDGQIFHLARRLCVANALFILIAVMAACSGAPKGKSKSGIGNYTNCFLPPDQGQGSLYGRWGALPITLALDRDFYLANNGEALTPLRNAINSWNAWGALKGRRIFNIAYDGAVGSGTSAGLPIPEVPDCALPSFTAAVSGVVGIWKIRTSGPGRNKRDTCSSDVNGGKLLNDNWQGVTDLGASNGKIVSSSIFLNFDAWNSTPSTTKVDVESLLLHELGHSLGLLHSCNPGSGDITSAPNCSLSQSAYQQAVMFPSLTSSQLRRGLQENDYNRINCLY